MKQAILDFAEQCSFEPEIQNNRLDLASFDRWIVLGMGGSHLAADLIKTWDPYLNITIHSDYGLPAMAEERLSQRLIIANSYSGNTEEVIDGFKQALEHKLPVIAIAVGGKLLELAREHQVPYIQLPDTGIQPRLALGLSLRALLAAMHNVEGLQESSQLVTSLKPQDFELAGEELARQLAGQTPIIYASSKNYSLAYNWKIKLNETAKIPAFCNTLPELNHNEMTGFDAVDSTRSLSHSFHFILIEDPRDDERVKQRFQVLSQLYRERGFNVSTITLHYSGEQTPLQAYLACILYADWTAYYLAQHYGVDPEQVPMVESFKKLLK